MNATKIEDWFDTGEEFEAALEEALENAEADDDEGGMDFLDDLRTKWDDYGMRAFLSGSQHGRLMRLANPKIGD